MMLSLMISYMDRWARKFNTGAPAERYNVFENVILSIISYIRYYKNIEKVCIDNFKMICI